MKDEWRIKDFSRWDLEDEFSFHDAACLYCEVDPNNNENIPDEIWTKISEMLDTLRVAAEKETLYKPEFRDGSKPRRRTRKVEMFNKPFEPLTVSYHADTGDLARLGIVYRDDLIYFYSERLGQKPKFLFPEERKGGSAQVASFIHSPDYRSVTFHGRTFSLTSKSAKVIKILHEAYESGAPEVGDGYILEEIDAGDTKRLTDIFKDNRDAWKALIIEGRTKGSHKINI